MRYWQPYNLFCICSLAVAATFIGLAFRGVAIARPADVDTELEHCRRLATKYEAEPEVVLTDGSRVDLLSETHAYEVERAPVWAQAIGQAVHYGLQSQREPAIIILVSDPAKEWRHIARVARVCGRLEIPLHFEEI